jgi:hypothetical protein
LRSQVGEVTVVDLCGAQDVGDLHSPEFQGSGFKV